MAGVELSPLVPFPAQAGQLAILLDSFHAHLLKGTLYAMFKRANPGEAGRLETYWATVSPYPSVSTATGLALRDAYQAHHQAGG